ncbi:MAG: VCBS repeat-containing protein [Planctomycetaceae bacterium]|nr:VCBS repeat-containing protein [Planctomycetaceae bacterium]
MQQTISRMAAALIVVLVVTTESLPDEFPRPAQTPEDRVAAGLFPPGEPIPVAQVRGRGQLGTSNGFTATPLGTADVFGNGPYDLFLEPDQLFPFLRFDEQGVPFYGAPVRVGGERVNGDIVTGPDGTIFGVSTAGRKIRVSQFDRTRRRFERLAESPELDAPGALGGGAAGWIGENGEFHVYSTVSDGVAYRPPGDHHSATFMPYDGAGFWRGNIPRTILYHVRFDSPRMGTVRSIGRREGGEGPGEFLFGTRGGSVIRCGTDTSPMLMTSEKLGALRCFAIDESTGAPAQLRFVNNLQHVALKHHVINPSIKSIPDPATGAANLVVGDTGRLWFYRFAEQFAPNGSPVFHTPQPVMGEGMHHALGDLPVISLGDVDGDGLLDIMAGNDAGELLLLKNIGQKDRPEFDHAVSVPVGERPLDIKANYRGSIQGPGEAWWGYTCPTLYDWDGDGRPDVILNSILADYMFIRQVPSETGSAFAEPQLMYCDGLQLHLAWRSQPGITNWGRDRLCLIALDEQNLLRMFWKIDDLNVERGELLRLQDGSPITANADEAAGQTGRAKLVPHDWDGDGAIDLVIGTSRGLSFPASPTAFLPSHYYPDHKASVLLLRNVGTNDNPVFDYVKQFEFNGERIKLDIHSCSPAPVDLGRGVIDLLVGEEHGTIRYYPRESLTLSGVE